ncbi:hypothetical protein BGX38DRAFT_1233945 [Terfezia claveryi]|nr:hypothetical protein BGX38DRAFT_1233945 [Terfezia claveryi]
MDTFNLVLLTLLHLLLFSHTAECTYPTVRKQSVFQALRANGLEAYAGFLEQFPPTEISENIEITLFAPTNEAVKAYVAANPVDKIHRRDAAKNMQANLNNIRRGPIAMGGIRAKGQVVTTGRGRSSGNKVAQPARAGGGRGRGGSGGRGGSNGRRARNLNLDEGSQIYIATITAGGGVRTKVLQNSFPFDNGIIYKVDSFFNPTVDFGTTITAPSDFNLTYLRKIFDRMPHARDKLFGAQEITFLVPTQEAFDKTGLNVHTSQTCDLQEYLDNHTITSGFLGYTPSFEDGKCYTTDGGSQFFPKFNGTHTLLNDAVIVGENHIVATGVIQIINKVLCWPPSKCTA